MKIGKVFALIISILMLSSCGATNDISSTAINNSLNLKNPVTIEVWHYYNGPQQQAFDDLITVFNETVGADNKIIVDAYSQGNVSQLSQKVVDAAEKKVGAGDIPNIFAAYADTAYAIDSMGLVASLDKYMTKEEIDSYILGYIEEGRFDKEGNLKIFPVAKSTEQFLINKTIWDKFSTANNISIDSLNTMEGLVKISEQYYNWTDSLTTQPNDGEAFFGRDSMANYMLIGSKQLGVEIFAAQGGDVTLNVDKQIMRRLWDNFYIPYINGYFASYGRFRSDDIKTGKIAALVGSSSSVTYFPTHIIDKEGNSTNIEMLTLVPPRFENSTPVAVQQGAGMVVTKSEPQKEKASVIFLKWFTAQEQNLKFAIDSGYLPVNVKANDVKVLNDFIQQQPNVHEKLKEALPVALEVCNTHEMYTNKAFKNGTAARDVLEKSLITISKADYEIVKSAIEAGKSKEQAIENFSTDEYFDNWLKLLENELNDVINS